MQDRRARASEKAQRTKGRNADRGWVPRPPRPTALVQAERAATGRMTLDEAFGGVPSYARFAKLAPLYRSRDRVYMFYFPYGPGGGPPDQPRGQARSGLFWWRKDTADADDVCAGKQFVARCRELNDTVLLSVDRGPAGDAHRGPGSVRACTGAGVAFILRGSKAT